MTETIDAQKAFSGTVAPEGADVLDEAKLTAWMEAHVEGFEGPLTHQTGLSALDLLSGKKLQGALMGANRFPVEIPRLVDFYMRGMLDLDTIIAERVPLEKINYAFDQLRTGDTTRTVIVFE